MEDSRGWRTVREGRWGKEDGGWMEDSGGWRKMGEEGRRGIRDDEGRRTVEVVGGRDGDCGTGGGLRRVARPILTEVHRRQGEEKH